MSIAVYMCGNILMYVLFYISCRSSVFVIGCEASIFSYNYRCVFDHVSCTDIDAHMQTIIYMFVRM